MTLSGALLAGGASRRFGSDKAAHVYRGRTLLQHALASLASCDDLLVVGARMPPGADGRAIEDVRPGFGAASGLHAALVHARHDWVAVLACDMPFVPPAIWRFLSARTGVGGEEPALGAPGWASRASASGARRPGDPEGCSTGTPTAAGPRPLAVVAEGPAGLEPLVALYHRGLLPVLESALDGGGLALRDLVSRAPVRVVRWDDVRAAFDASVFVNVNRPEDLP